MDSDGRPTGSNRADDANPPPSASPNMDYQESLTELMHSSIAPWPFDPSCCDFVPNINYMSETSRDVRAAHYISNGVLYDLDTPNTLISRNGVQAHHENQHQVRQSSLNPNPSNAAQPITRTTDQHTVPHDRTRLTSDPDHRGGNNSSSSSSIKTKRSFINADRPSCTCKKAKCLKLYCECFSNGYYCTEPCTCEGCFNGMSHEDSVSKAFEQIQSREPDAFSPKVRVVEGANCSVASTVIHRRGCNCKKSFCVKKYCECYQASAACSDNCRCEGCKNTFGTRNEYIQNANAETVNETGSKDIPSAEKTRSNLRISSPDPSMEPGALERRDLQEPPTQDGIDSNLGHNVPDTDPAQDCEGTMGSSNSPNAAPSDSFQGQWDHINIVDFQTWMPPHIFGNRGWT